jgi:LIM domain kinase 1
MSPEILIGDEFGIETDIFSLGRFFIYFQCLNCADDSAGVILCEISSRRLVDDYTYKRLMPSFGLDPDEIRELASPDCPPAFIELAIACVAEEPSHRPTIRAVLEKLMVIERAIIESQASEGYNVGSLTYSAKHAGRQTKSSKLKRPQPGRIPSFKGQVKPSYSVTGAIEGGDSSSDEDVDETLAKLEKLRVGGKGSIYLGPKGAEATSRLLDIVDDDKSSTYAVIKGSKMSTRSSFLQREKEDTSSIITVKGQANPSVFSTGSSLPSLPASWIQAANDAIEKREQEAKAQAAGPEPVPSASVESKQDSASTSSEDLPITPEPEVQVTAEPEAITPTNIMPGSLPESKFDTIKSLSTPVAVTPEFLNTTLSDMTGGRPGPHRFTLIKPGWKALWESPTPSDKGHNKRQSRSGDVSGRSSMDSNAPRKSFDGEREKVAYTGGLAAMLPVHLLSVGLLTKCHTCEKRLGLMKPYLACDDCQKV